MRPTWNKKPEQVRSAGTTERDRRSFEPRVADVQICDLGESQNSFESA